MDEVKLNKVKRVLLSMQRYSWEQGTAMQAFLEAGDMDTVICMAYEPRAEFLYRSVNAGVDSYGFVRDVCGAPVFDSLGLSAEGQAFYILMCSAAEKYFSLK